MSGLAHIMKERGFSITGSDILESSITKKLVKDGVKIAIGHKRVNLADYTDAVVVSSAIPKNNPEIEKALELGIPIVKRSYVLGQLMKKQRGIAISGTHGKTTTTTMITLLLQAAKMDPAALIGGEVKNIGGNFLAGKGQYFIAEACEYDRSFLDFYPEVAVITNIEEDHLDYYRDLAEIKKAFKKFVAKIPKKGLLIFSMDDRNAYEVAQAARCHVIGYGFSSKNRMEGLKIDSYWEVEEVAQEKGKTRFSVSNGKKMGEFILHIPGKHNVSNACASIIVADYLGIDPEIMKKTLADFSGTKRRFEILGEKGGVVIIDDYAHHPTEIKATLEGVKKFYKEKKIVAVFEPHQYSRTRLLLKEFGACFDNADLVIIPGIYAVRDSKIDIKSVTPKDLVSEIEKNGTNAIYIEGYEKTIQYLQKNLGKDTILLTLGAGNVYKIGEGYMGLHF